VKGDTIYVWQVLEDGAWGTIMAKVGWVDEATVLVTRDLQIAQAMGLLAVAHHDSTGLPVRCAQFDDPTVIRTIP